MNWNRLTTLSSSRSPLQWPQVRGGCRATSGTAHALSFANTSINPFQSVKLGEWLTFNAMGPGWGGRCLFVLDALWLPITSSSPKFSVSVEESGGSKWWGQGKCEPKMAERERERPSMTKNLSPCLWVLQLNLVCIYQSWTWLAKLAQWQHCACWFGMGWRSSAAFCCFSCAAGPGEKVGMHFKWANPWSDNTLITLWTETFTSHDSSGHWSLEPGAVFGVRSRLVKAQAPKSWLRGAHALAAWLDMCRLQRAFQPTDFYLQIEARRLYNCTSVRSCSFSWSFLAILFGAPAGRITKWINLYHESIMRLKVFFSLTGSAICFHLGRPILWNRKAPGNMGGAVESCFEYGLPHKRCHVLITRKSGIRFRRGWMLVSTTLLLFKGCQRAVDPHTSALLSGWGSFPLHRASESKDVFLNQPLRRTSGPSEAFGFGKRTWKIMESVLNTAGKAQHSHGEFVSAFAVCWSTQLFSTTFCRALCSAASMLCLKTRWGSPEICDDIWDITSFFFFPNA